MRTERWGLAALLTVTVVWGTDLPRHEAAVRPTCRRCKSSGCALVCRRLVLLPLWRGMRGAPNAAGAWCLGVLKFIAFWLQVEGLAHTTSNRNAFVTGLNVLVVPILAWLVLRRRTGWQVWAACALAVAGMCLMFFEDAPWNWGDTLTLCSTVVYALYILALEEAAAPHHQPRPCAPRAWPPP